MQPYKMPNIDAAGIDEGNLFQKPLIFIGLRVLNFFGGGQKYKGRFITDNRVRVSHARGVYPTQDTPRTKTVRVKQEEEADKNNSKK